MATTRIPKRKVAEAAPPAESTALAGKRTLLRPKTKAAPPPDAEPELADRPPTEDEIPGPAAAPEATVERELESDPDDDLSGMDKDLDEVEDALAPAAPPQAAPKVPAKAPVKDMAKKAAPEDPATPPRKAAAAGTLRVARQFPGGEETSEESLLEVRPFVTVPASVSVSFGTTVNLGDYQSAKVMVGVTLPCYVEELDAAYAAAAEFAEKHLAVEVNAIRSAKDGVDPVADDEVPAAPPKPTKAPVPAADVEAEDDELAEVD